MSQQIIKSSNMKKIFLLIQKNRTISRTDLAKLTRLSKTTVSTLIDELIAGEYVLDCGAGVSNATGRKPNVLMINGSKHFIAVFQWYVNQVVAKLISLDGEVVREESHSVKDASMFSRITSTILYESFENDERQARILGVCIIVPAIVDPVTQKMFSVVLGIAPEDEAVSRLRELIHDYPIVILSDVACNAYAECIESSLDDVYFAFVYIGKGVGAVMLNQGKMFCSASGMTTQFGHFSVDRKGPLCNCGNLGCLERMVGESFIFERAVSSECSELFPNEQAATFKYLKTQMGCESKKAHRLLDVLAGDMAFALSNLVALFNPKEIIVGGSCVVLGSEYLEALKKSFNNIGFPPFSKQVKLRFSSISATSVFKAAARYYIDQYFTFDGEMSNNLYIG